jgi:hypothetical protein
MFVAPGYTIVPIDPSPKLRVSSTSSELLPALA